MSNTQGDVNLFTVIVKKGKEEEALLSLLSLDNDFSDEEDSQKIIKKVCKKHKTLIKRIYAIIKSYVEGSQFLIGNQTYCSGYTVDVVDIDKDTQVVAIAYIT